MDKIVRMNGNAKPVEFALTLEIKNQLRDISKRLPRLPEHVPIFGKVDGMALLEKGYQNIKQNGKTSPVIAGKKYTVPTSHELRDVNHITNLFTIYKRGGILGVHSYIVELVGHEAKARENYPNLFADDGKGEYLGVAALN